MSQYQSLKVKTISNLSVSAAAVLLVNVAQFATSIILARMLMASDYGIVGYSQIIINFMMQFSDFGLNSALIQRKEISEETLYSGFALKILLSLAAMSLILLSSPYFVYIFDNKNMQTVISLLSLNFLFSIFSFLPQVVLTRDLMYKKLVLPQTLGVCLGAAVSIAMAYTGYGFWSLVVGNLVNNCTAAFLLNVLNPVRYRFSLDREAMCDLARFGWNMVLPGIIIFIIMNVDNFMVGSFSGALMLGYYTIAFNWGSMICTLLSGIVHKVLFPTFSQMQHNLDEIKKWYLKSLKYIALVAVPINVGLLLLSREFLVWVLGKGDERWIPALAALRILCLYGIARALLEPVGNVISAIGKPHYFVRATYVVAIAEVAGVSAAVFFSAHLAWIAAAVLLAYLTQFLVYYRIMRAEISLSLPEVYRALFAAVVAALCMAGALLLLKIYLPFSIQAMVLQIAIGAVVYLTAYGFCDRWSVFKELAQVVSR